MANLNFQQPPRSIAASGLGGVGVGVGVGGRSGGVVGFGGVGGAGGGSGGASASLPLSPQSAVPPPPLVPARSALFGQRAFAERRAVMPGGGGIPNSNSMAAVRGAALQGVVLGGGDGTGAPPLLDPSEFPSLTARGQGDQPHHHVPTPGSKPYVGMVKQPTAEQSEFTMSSEDFPALPGTSAGGVVGPGGGGQGSQGLSDLAVPPSSSLLGSGAGGGGIGGQSGSHSLSLHAPSDIDKSRQDIHTSPDGKVSNIPSTMVPNQYGIVGLLTFIRAAESNPELVSLALGQDLTTLGLNLNSPDNLYLTFAGPWAEAPCRPQDIDYHVPPEYLINVSIREKLAPPLKLSRYKEDLLFYIFYCFVGDILQVAAAAELYSREWRYHTEEKVWITQAPGVPTLEKTSTYERGTYYYFDPHSWRKVAKEFHLDYSKLEGRPLVPHYYHL